MDLAIRAKFSKEMSMTDSQSVIPYENPGSYRLQRFVSCRLWMLPPNLPKSSGPKLYLASRDS